MARLRLEVRTLSYRCEVIVSKKGQRKADGGRKTDDSEGVWVLRRSRSRRVGEQEEEEGEVK